jgi:hypothetical protein
MAALTPLEELHEAHIADLARESIILTLYVSFFIALDGRIEKHDLQSITNQFLTTSEKRGFYYYLFGTPWFEKYRTFFQVFVDATSIWCDVGIVEEDGKSVNEIPIKTFPRHDIDAGDLGRHLAEVCLDLNQKLCDVIDDESWGPGTLLRCSECRLMYFGESHMDVTIDTIKHIIEKHPMRSLTKSAGKK